MASLVENVVESKKEELAPAENLDMETARAKGNVAIGIAKLQPTVRLLITYAEIWAYYTLIPFKVGQLTMDVIVLGLEITKLSLMSVKANTNLFVQLFQQILALLSPDFILKLIQSFSTILTSLVEKIMQDLLIIVQKIVSPLTAISEKMPIADPIKNTKETIAVLHKTFQPSDGGHEDPEPTHEAAASQKHTVNGETPEKSDKKGK